MTIGALQKQHIFDILDGITSATGSPRKRQLAGMFLEIVDRNSYPEYYDVIPAPRSLDQIRQNLEKNKYKQPVDAYNDISLVFWNAIYYNEEGSQITRDATILKTMLQNEWKARNLPPGRESPPPNSAQKRYAVAPEPEEDEDDEPSSSADPPIHAPTPVSAAVVASGTTAEVKPTVAATAPVAPVLVAPQDSDTEDEAIVPEPPNSGPSDIQLLRHLERGLPKFVGDTSAEGGWMEDVKHERHLEIMQTLKAYKDASGAKLSAVLEPGMPEEKLGITFKLLDSRSRSKTYYTSSRQFDLDIAKLLESGRRFYLEKADTLAGVGGDEWAKVVALQRLANELSSKRCPAVLPFSEPISYAVPLTEPGKETVEAIVYKGFAIRVGDFVHIVPGREPGDNTMGFGRGRPLVCRITACWKDDTGEAGVSVRWYLRADEVKHLMKPETRKRGDIFEGEIVQTDKLSHHHVVDVIERVACQHSSSASRGRPRAPKWYPGWPLYVCGYRYDGGSGRVRHIRRAEWFSAKGGGGTDKEVLDIFERPIRFSPRRGRAPFVSDRSVTTAGGMAVSGQEELPAETVRHFERDPQTGEVLWFPGPPQFMARVPGPRHSLEYLNFLANKYNPKPAKEDAVVVNGNGVDHTMEVDDFFPPAKRLKVDEAQEYKAASEIVRDAYLQ
ncbi:hypothetical protein MKEN_01061800 [Mycena kentingensis (nom. inval.)]|nr:hypothetical protein MKEN_01061800 [Mycena kentingensis (nom. inval.)]